MAQRKKQVSQVIEKLYSDIESYIERTLIRKYKLTDDDTFMVRSEIMDAIAKRWLDGSAVIVELDDPESFTAPLQKLCPNLTKALEKEAALEGRSLSDIIENDADYFFQVLISTVEEEKEFQQHCKQVKANYDMPTIEPTPTDWMN